MKKRRIVILMHENDNENSIENYLIKFLVEEWQEAGHEVIQLFGTKKFVSADIIFVHVDLTVVPEHYLEFAQQYPVTINTQVKDIRKSGFGTLHLTQQDSWDGQVLVKTDKNCAGIPERVRNGFWGKVQKKIIRTCKEINHSSYKPFMETPLDYQIFDNLSLVPKFYFYHAGYVVQKFIPEMDGDLYCVRFLNFFGDQMSCIRLKSRHPIVTGNTAKSIEFPVKPHPDILAICHRFQFDYGKFDYVEVDGDAFLLDMNKTVGISSSLTANPDIHNQLKKGAEGLYSFFDE